MSGGSTTVTEVLGPCSCARMSVEDTVVPETSSEDAELVDAELVRTSPQLGQRVLRAGF